MGYPNESKSNWLLVECLLRKGIRHAVDSFARIVATGTGPASYLALKAGQTKTVVT